MRRQLAVPFLLAACLLTSVALAAPDKVEVTFESFAASGVTGEAALKAMPTGEVQIHAALRGLEPGVEYAALIYDQSGTCGEGTSNVQIIMFEANPAGIATWNQKVERDLVTIESLGIRRVSDGVLQACASVNL